MNKFSANSFYAHQAFVSAEFSGTKGTKESLSQCQGYRYEIEPNDFTKRAFTDTVFQRDKDEFTFTVRWQYVYLLVKLYFSQMSTSD